MNVLVQLYVEESTLRYLPLPSSILSPISWWTCLAFLSGVLNLKLCVFPSETFDSGYFALSCGTCKGDVESHCLHPCHSQVHSRISDRISTHLLSWVFWCLWWRSALYFLLKGSRSLSSSLVLILLTFLGVHHHVLGFTLLSMSIGFVINFE